VVHDFTWKWVSDSGNSGAQEFGMLNTAAAEPLCGVSMDPSDHTLNVNVPVKFGTIGSDIPKAGISVIRVFEPFIRGA
jgi:hypothetical protein